MRTEEKSEYLELALGLLGDTHPDLKQSLKKMKTQSLIHLSKSLSDVLGKQMPNFPTRTQAQKKRLSFLRAGTQDESNRISQPAITSDQ